jgi:ribulose-5-phosphate 4-epimerase/fuculose-1-phosphate aldolase
MKSHAALLASHHGPVVAGKTLRDAEYATRA